MIKTFIFLLFSISACVAYAQQTKPQKGDPNADITIGVPTTSSNTAVDLLHDDTKIFTAVEREPQFPGGQQKLYDYIKANLKYPAVAHDNKVQGKVFVTFVVERNGSLSDIRVLRGIGSGCDEEALRLLKNCPRWNPGIQSNTAVHVQYMVPVTFQLQEEQ